MLTLETTGRQRNCEGLSRCELLRVGCFGLGGLALPDLLYAKSESNFGFVRDKAVVLLFLGGGPSHIETFNPNMTAPAPFRSVTGEVKTNVPGITLGRLASGWIVTARGTAGRTSRRGAIPNCHSRKPLFCRLKRQLYCRLQLCNSALAVPNASRWRLVDGGRCPIPPSAGPSGRSRLGRGPAS